VRALVIDDSKPVRSILQRMLRDLGFEVTLASDGQDALQQLDPHTPPDLVTVNWEMPHLDGLGFLRAFRGQPPFRRVPVIMVSGEDRPPQIAEAKAAGADAYVVKPVSPTALEETLRQLGVLKCERRDVPSSPPPQAATSRIRVLVVDDSVIVRRTLTHVLNEDSEMEVVGAAVDGRVALDCLTQVTPDIMVLDIEMPRMNGFEVLQVLRKERPTLPVVMFSSLTERGAAATLEALMLGANDYVLKPTGMRSFDVARQCIRDELIPRIKQLVRATQARGARSAGVAAVTPRPARTARAASVEIVVIGVSTGGPAALARLLPTVVPQCPVPVVIVQHMPPMFTRLLAERLSVAEHLPVHEASDQQVLRGGEVWIAPGGHHTTLARSGGRLQVRLTEDPPENSCRPAADVLFRSAAAVCGARTLAVVLTGMGRDGLRGCEQIVQAGGQVLAQDEATSVVWGMPGQVVQAGLADEIVALERLGAAILRRVSARPQREQGIGPAQS
jgi:two-component system, chemotaxis family, protein-glutamate methylesterase/glutaminase